MRMESFWRWLGVALGRHWKFVVAAVVLITLVLGLAGRNIEFATGQDSYLNPDSQIAIDNVAFQDDFGGETVILLFSSNDGSDVSKLYEGANLAELERITDELSGVDGAYAVVTPLTSLRFSANLLSGGASSVGSRALLAALARDEAGADARQADVTVSLARLGAVDDAQRVIGDPAYNRLLIYDNTGFAADGTEVTAPADGDLVIRKSLQSTFPNVEGGSINGTAVGGVVLDGNATLDEQTAATKQVLDVLDGVTFDGFDLTVTGSPVYLAEINDYLQGGMLTLGAAALALMAVVLAIMFRVRWRLLPLLSVFIGVLWAFSILGIIGIDLSLVTISGLPILIGVGIDFAIQVHNRVEEEVVLDKEAHPIAETLANLAPPLFAATLTGVVAFLALRISKVPMIRDFGILLAIGIAVLVVVGIVVTASALGIREYTKRTDVRPPSLVERIVVKLGGLPSRFGLPLVILAGVLFIGGVLAEGSAKIESDPIKWIDQDSQVVQDIQQLEDETGFSSTLGILVAANNIYDQQVIDLIWDFTLDAEARDEVVSSSSMVNTMGKIIAIEGATPIAPTSDDVLASVNGIPGVDGPDPMMPDDIAKALLRSRDDTTATQLNLRLAPASLEDRATLVEELEADLQARIDALELPADSVLLVDLPDGQAPVRATPAGLATVGIGLLENLSANRANLTYLALSLAGLFLVLRLRSVTRALLALVPVLLAVGVSSLVVGLLGFTLSPLTTVSGPLVIASCAEFSVLILGRYLEERQRGLSPRDASDTAASRTGRAFFTSAVTTICGFAVLIGSALPLLRDFGLIVTLNVAIALLAALVVMPPLSVWVDERGWLGTQTQGADPTGSVRLAAPLPGPQTVGAAVGVVGFVAAGIGVYATADTSTGEASEISYAATPLPTTTTTTTSTVPPSTVPGDTVPEGPVIDPNDFGTERPTSPVGGIVFDNLIELGVPANQANCAIESVEGGIDNVDAGAVLAGDDAAAAPVVQAGLDCGIDQATIDATIAAIRGG
jgi:hydrophobe/amphiphile efflux-3 (HAE3) family protein